jgi:hypothetical protein
MVAAMNSVSVDGLRQTGPRHALDDVMNALNRANPSRVINLAYFLGSDPPRGRRPARA